MKTTEILTSINAFMGQMRDGNTRELIANQQAALDYQTEKLRIYEEKYKAEAPARIRKPEAENRSPMTSKH